MKEQLIVRITGGLGNQMFQYAVAYVLSRRYPERIVKLDTTWYRQNHVHNGFELQSIFNYDGHGLSLEVATDAEIRHAGHSLFTPVMRDGFWGKLLEPLRGKMEWHLQRWAAIQRRSSILDENVCKAEGLDYDRIADKLKKLTIRTGYIRGYWQEFQYIQEYLSDIKQEFVYPKLDIHNQKLLDHITKCDSVSVHIRRGDYVGSDFDVLPKDYYKRAIDYTYTLLKQPVFFFFSEDEEYIKEQFAWVPDKRIVTGNSGKDSYKDMQLMSACKINIIANSSFSKWAGLLNCNEDRKVLYSKYYHREFNQEIIKDDNWICMDCDVEG